MLVTTNGAFASGQKTDINAELPRGVDPKTGFRIGRYRVPTPDTIPGGVVVDDAWMKTAAKDASIALIDVFPPKGLGPDLFDGTWRNSEKRSSIAGATWLPEVGRGHLEPEAKDYLQRNLTAISKGDKNTAMVFFCTADCWQGWNAARRAILLGYTAVHWYPAGTDGWLETGGEVVNVKPVNFLGPGN